MPRNRVNKTYTDAIPLLEPGDALFYHGRSLMAKGIHVAGLSPYSHVGMVGINKQGTPVLIEVVQWHGGRVKSIRGEVNKHPGSYDLFKVNTKNFPEYDRAKAEARMWEFIDTDYGWGSIGWASLLFLPGLRLFQKVEKFCIDDEATAGIPPYCSMACAIADDYGGVDPVNELRHSLTNPGEYSRSKLRSYCCTLVPDPPHVQPTVSQLEDELSVEPPASVRAIAKE